MDGSLPPGKAVCADCRQVLTSRTQYNGEEVVEVTWHHGFPAAGHDPQPVMVDAIDPAAMRCDFCSRPGPIWSFATRQGIAMYAMQDTPHGPTPTISAGDNAWAACDECANLIVSNRRRELLRRAVSAFSFGASGQAALRALQEAFFEAEPQSPTRIDGTHHSSPAKNSYDTAGTIVDELVGQIDTQRRLAASEMPEMGQLADVVSAAAMADRRPEIPPRLLRALRDRPRGEEVNRGAMSLARLYAITRLWRRGRLVYSIDADLWSNLGDFEEGLRLPLNVLQRLPHPNPFLVFPQPLVLPSRTGHRRIIGAFIVGQHADPEFMCGTHSDATDAFRLILVGRMYTDDGQPVMAPDMAHDITFIHLPLPTSGEITIAELADFAVSRMEASPLDGDDLRGDVAAMLRRAMSLLVYVCSRNADLQERPAQRSRSSKRARRVAQRRSAPSTVIEVGYRIGAKLRGYASRRDQRHAAGDQSGTGHAIPPHIRRAHLHMYRVGAGREGVEWRFLDPIPVNMGDEAKQTTVIPVPPEQA